MSRSGDEVVPPGPLPWAGGPYSIKRHGVTITTCDSEPVRTPGCVQDRGALLVVRLADFVVLQASENSGRFLGRGPEALLGRPVDALLGAEHSGALREFLAREPAECNPLHVCNFEGLDVSAHTIDGLLVLEFEPSTPSRGGPPDYYALVKKTVARLHSAPGLRAFCDAVTEDVRALTGLDRVMVYRFHQDGHGEVFAESKGAGLPSWLGLHYPADDIPEPARDVFRRTWVRPLPDAAGGLAELVPLANPDTGRPLDMTHCALRGASVMYTEYLRNMGVTASLTMPIRRDEGLWGLIAGHHYGGPFPMPYQVRAACEFVAQVVSLQHKSAEEREQNAERVRLERAHHDLVLQASHPGGLPSLTEGPLTLLDGIRAGGAAIFHLDRWWVVGQTPTEGEIAALSEWIQRTRPGFRSPSRPCFATESLAGEYPEAAAYAGVASGVLAVPLSRDRRTLVLWFRPEVIRTLHWGGNPHDKPTVVGPNGPRLTPRRSFELYAESVRRTALPWLDVEVDAAQAFRLLVMELVVNRAERLSILNDELTRSNEELDAFAYVASHDLKEPLRGIHKYAHQLLAEADGLGGEQRGRLERLMRLTLRMDDLLDSLLHFSRAGRVAFVMEASDPNEVLAEAVEIVGFRDEEGGGVEIRVPRPLPWLRCDRTRLREIFTNLLSNAIKYNDAPAKVIEVGFVAPESDGPPPGCPGPVPGGPILYVKDNGIGIHPRHFAQVFRIFRRLHGRDEYGGGTGAGLTIVRKLVERHYGQIWIDSAPGRGSAFYFTLPCDDSEPIDVD